MNNEQLIKSAHVWAVSILLACAILAVASERELGAQDQSQNNNSKTSDTTKSKTGMGTSDRNFMMEAAMGGLMEVALGRLAVAQGSSDVVKQFGQRMVDDHSKANSELMQLASTKGVTLPTELDQKHRNAVTKMSRLTGANFDMAYAKAMMSDHVKDVSAFEKQSMKGSDADLKAFAANTLLTLKEHLDMAKGLHPASMKDMKHGKSNHP